MKFDVLQILGAAVAVIFCQGLIRLLVHHDDRGLLGWVPGGFLGVLLAHVALTAAGAALTSWAHTRAKAAGRRG
ncbi:hypothetical protein GCM10010218_61460 [Streptomyces mashuensis]|uniref:Uncharacterized protein n=1 Tax=Streptomyces mashuensis TaxID=33904 RepID=A0A919B985_9ACTN|nr:hypothetical protein [Streptomyces mashuensis]GHF71905.1 hypothetical protein GCM10010218_61460 [Streptomyces mashuensis]